MCGREVGQLFSPARAGFYEGLFVCTDQAVSARMVCKMRCTIGSCCSRRNLPQILQEILRRPEFGESIARLLEFGPREIACAFRNMLQIPFVPMPLPSSVTDCILSFLRTDFSPACGSTWERVPDPMSPTAGTALTAAQNSTALMPIGLGHAQDPPAPIEVDRSSGAEDGRKPRTKAPEAIACQVRKK